MTNTELAVRAARAEIERDKAIARAQSAEHALVAYTTKDTEAMLNTLHVMGIPARDLKDIYAVVQEWHANGGRPELLDTYRELADLKAAIPIVTDERFTADTAIDHLKNHATQQLHED